MSNSLIKAYALGKRLALIKVSQELGDDAPPSSEVDELTKKLESLVQGSSPTSNDILDAAERSSSATWGDKMELETNSNTGINV